MKRLMIVVFLASISAQCFAEVKKSTEPAVTIFTLDDVEGVDFRDEKGEKIKPTQGFFKKLLNKLNKKSKKPATKEVPQI